MQGTNKTGEQENDFRALPPVIQSASIAIGYEKTCDCSRNHLNCLTAKEWIKCQVGIWRFSYSGVDIRDKAVHPATFPVALAKQVISLFSHQGELVVDPFVGSGTSLIAAQELNRNALGFDLQKPYIDLCKERLGRNNLFNQSQQLPIHDNARNIPKYIRPGTISLLWTSPPYANLLNRKRKNKSLRGDERKNDQFGKVEQYSQDPRDLGTMALDQYTSEMGDIYEDLLPLLRPKAHCVINVPDMWWENERITLHVALIEELRRRGYELRNTIIWDRTNIVNNIGIFGWPANYITMGTTFEYLLDFWRPPALTENS
jgi:DNA modification methylase